VGCGQWLSARNARGGHVPCRVNGCGGKRMGLTSEVGRSKRVEIVCVRERERARSRATRQLGGLVGREKGKAHD
jgi:hypothetical protein